MQSAARRFVSFRESQEKAARRFDLIAFFAALALALTGACAAYPAFKAGPSTAGGLLLLVGLGAVLLLGIFAFGNAGSAAQEEGAGVELLVDALSEPAAVVSLAGQVRTANAAWRSEIDVENLSRAALSASGLFTALNAARDGGAGEFGLRVGDRDVTLVASQAGRDLLVRVAPSRAPDLGETMALELAPPPPPQPPGASLDAFAAAAPFGAALVEGDDPFTAHVVQSNAVMVAMAGGAPTGQVFGDLIDPASRTEAIDRMAQGKPGPYEVRLAADQTRIAQLYLTGGAGRFLAYLVDVSEQKQMELQLAQSQKMQAIGQLAGGVAHDFNNLLTAIELRLDELLQRHPVGDPSYEGLSQIRQTGARAADLVRKLLAFSRKQTVQRVTLDIGELISESQVLLSRLLPEDIQLDPQYGRDLPKVRADKGQLETAVMNLVVNARDAVKSQGRGGVIRIRSARLSQAEAVALNYADPLAQPGRELALIEVSDNGPGIPADVIKKIFDPFFTTKAVGEGTGLGLSTVYGIVKQMDGWIDVSNLTDAGACFRIFLPVYDPPPAELAAAEPVKARPAPRDLSGAGRILFVEDEDAVRTVAARLLRARGYEVMEAADGEEALEMCEQHAGQIDLLISDVIMPGMDGPTLLKKARGYLGNAPVMFISGYAESDFSDLLEGEEGITFLPKPIDIKTLAERVKQQLQGG